VAAEHDRSQHRRHVERAFAAAERLKQAQRRVGFAGAIGAILSTIST
jgi:hypothetical protein